MVKESKAEAMTVKDEDMRSMSGHPEKHELSVKSTLPEGMKDPVSPGEQQMGGVVKGSSSGDGMDRHMGNTGMGNATAQLRYETERGEHAPEVGGHKDAGHQHAGMIMKKA